MSRTGEKIVQRKIDILGIPFDNLTREESLKCLYQRLLARQKTFLGTANPEIVMYAKSNQDYCDVLLQADYITPYGIGIVKASKKLGTSIQERVPGFEVMLGLLEIADIEKRSVYFIGAAEEVIELTVQEVKKKWPDITVAGYHHGYFDHEGSKMIEKVRQTNPDIVLVAFGFPRQERWIERYLEKASMVICA